MFNDFDEFWIFEFWWILHLVCTGTSKKIKIDSQTDEHMENVGRLSTHLHDIHQIHQMHLL